MKEVNAYFRHAPPASISITGRRTAVGCFRPRWRRDYEFASHRFTPRDCAKAVPRPCVERKGLTPVARQATICRNGYSVDST